VNARRRVISVIGAGECSADEAQAAEAVGRELARRGVVLVCGGRGGAMEAACRGACEVGGITIGLLPGNDREDGNDYLTLALPTGMGHARNALVVLSGEAVIAIGGEAGTLSEIGLAIKSGRHVIGLGTWECISADGRRLAIHKVGTPEQAVAAALEGQWEEDHSENA